MSGSWNNLAELRPPPLLSMDWCHHHMEAECQGGQLVLLPSRHLLIRVRHLLVRIIMLRWRESTLPCQSMPFFNMWIANINQLHWHPPAGSNKNSGAFSASRRKEVLLSMLQSLGCSGRPITQLPQVQHSLCNTRCGQHASYLLQSMVMVACSHWIPQQQGRIYVKKVGLCRAEHVLEGRWARCHFIILAGWLTVLDFFLGSGLWRPCI